MEWQSDSRSHSRIQTKNSGIRKLKDEWIWQPLKLGPGVQGYDGHQLGELLEDEAYPCGFCSGTGEKPRGSRCSVCKGKGTVSVEPPAVKCAFCKGRGEEKPRTNVTCTACRGKGIIHVQEPIEICPHCRGTGKEPTNKLICITCRGKGVVTVNPVRSEIPQVSGSALAKTSNGVKEEDTQSADLEQEIGAFAEKGSQINETEKEMPVRSASVSEHEALEVEEKFQSKVEEEPVHSASVSEHEVSELEEKSQGQVQEEPVRSASGSEREALEVVKKSGRADGVAVARNMSPPVSSGYAEQLCNALVRKGLLTRDRTLYSLTSGGEKALGNFRGG